MEAFWRHARCWGESEGQKDGYIHIFRERDSERERKSKRKGGKYIDRERNIEGGREEGRKGERK